jgi:glycosyltransferase involved in cell wall biosynthesis
MKKNRFSIGGTVCGPQLALIGNPENDRPEYIMPSDMLDKMTSNCRGRTIGVAIITKNRNDFVKQVYEYHLLNTVPFVDTFIIVDDHSDIPIMLKDFDDPYAKKEKWGRVEVHRPSKWLGVAGARNYALEKLQGHDYIFLLDDDLLPKSPDWIPMHIKALDNNFCKIDLLIHYPNELDECKSHVNWSAYVGVTVTNSSTATLFAMTKECLNTLGGFDNTMGYYGHEDTDYFTRARAVGILPPKGYWTLINSEFYLHAFDIYGDYPPIKWMHKSALGDAKYQMIEQSRTRLIEINATGDNPIYKPFAG